MDEKSKHNFVQDTLRNISAKFHIIPLSSFRGEDFEKLTDNDDDRRKVMAIAYMAYGQVSKKWEQIFHW